jgi:hypothetical protein
MIDQVYSASGIRDALVTLLNMPDRRLAQGALDLYRALETPRTNHELYELFAEFLVFLRENLERSNDPTSALAAITATIPIEQDIFVLGRHLAKPDPRVSRSEWLRRLTSSLIALYGSGLISEREYRSVRTVLAELDQPNIPIETLYRELSYLSVVPSYFLIKVAGFPVPFFSFRNRIFSIAAATSTSLPDKCSIAFLTNLKCFASSIACLHNRNISSGLVSAGRFATLSAASKHKDLSLTNRDVKYSGRAHL